MRWFYFYFLIKNDNSVDWLRHDGHDRKKIQPLYDGHIPINPLQRAILAVGSSIVSLTNPSRAGQCLIKERKKQLTFPFLCWLNFLNPNRHDCCKWGKFWLLCPEEDAQKDVRRLWRPKDSLVCHQFISLSSLITSKCPLFLSLGKGLELIQLQ